MTPRDRAERLRGRARTDPSAVNPDAVLELLRHPSRAVQHDAADALLLIVTELPAVATGGVGRIDYLLQRIDRSVEGPAAHAEFGETLPLCLARIAGADVEKSLDAAHTVLTALDPDGPLAAPASACLTRLIAVRPEAFVPDVDQISALFDEIDADAAGLRANAVGVLADLAADLPAAIDGRQATLTDRVDDEATPVRRNVAAAVGRLANAGVELDEPAHGGLVELLDDPDATVRITACRALGQLASPAAAELLRTTANEDEELAVRKAAERALED